MFLKLESFGSLGDFHPTLKIDYLKLISHKKFNEFIKVRGFKGRKNYLSKDLTAMFGFKPLKADREASVVSSEDMEPTTFGSMKKAARAIGIGKGVIRYSKTMGQTCLTNWRAKTSRCFS